MDLDVGQDPNDGTQKKIPLQQLVKEYYKELHEVIAYMDYSFERAFTIQEKEYMLAYKVSRFFQTLVFPWLTFLFCNLIQYHKDEIQKDINGLKVDPNDIDKLE